MTSSPPNPSDSLPHPPIPSPKELRKLPGVDKVLGGKDGARLVKTYGASLATYAVRTAIAEARSSVREGRKAPPGKTIVGDAARIAEQIVRPSLVPVVNATGVILHTNLGRAPLGKPVIEEIAKVASGYSNLEFDLGKAERGDRRTHAREILKFITTAEDVLVVNNNAAGILLALNTLARGREVIVSRGELIEIGASFRIPEIMEASGVRMKEVGTTNRTRISDYEKAITEDTAVLFKAHTSNYAICGFTEDTEFAELAELGKSRGIPVMYDTGSGLLNNPHEGLGSEPDVVTAIAEGADIVAFSCDKLLGGPQAGVLAGRADLLARMARNPLMRTVRVGKLTLAALSAVCAGHVDVESRKDSNPTFAMLHRDKKELDRLAQKLVRELKKAGIGAKKVESKGRCGGGSLPGVEIETVAVEILPGKEPAKGKQTFAEALFEKLLEGDQPVLGILREGSLLFDMLTVTEDEIGLIASRLIDTCNVSR